MAAQAQENVVGGIAERQMVDDEAAMVEEELLG